MYALDGSLWKLYITLFKSTNHKKILNVTPFERSVLVWQSFSLDLKTYVCTESSSSSNSALMYSISEIEEFFVMIVNILSLSVDQYAQTNRFNN